MHLTGKLKITTPDSLIVQRINKSLVDHLNEVFPLIENNVSLVAKDLLRRAIKDTPEYKSLIGGQLENELGMPNADIELKNIIDLVVDTVRISFTKARQVASFVGKSINVEFRVFAVPMGMNFLLSSGYGKYTTSKGKEIPWLKWLLTAGDMIIIRGYEVRFGSFLGSRTGGAIMKEGDKFSWRVPPQFSGTLYDNFITRACDNCVDKIGEFILKEFEARW